MRFDRIFKLELISPSFESAECNVEIPNHICPIITSSPSWDGVENMPEFSFEPCYAFELVHSTNRHEPVVTHQTQEVLCRPAENYSEVYLQTCETMERLFPFEPKLASELLETDTLTTQDQIDIPLIASSCSLCDLIQSRFSIYHPLTASSIAKVDELDSETHFDHDNFDIATAKASVECSSSVYEECVIHTWESQSTLNDNKDEVPCINHVASCSLHPEELSHVTVIKPSLSLAVCPQSQQENDADKTVALNNKEVDVSEFDILCFDQLDPVKKLEHICKQPEESLGESTYCEREGNPDIMFDIISGDLFSTEKSLLDQDTDTLSENSSNEHANPNSESIIPVEMLISIDSSQGSEGTTQNMELSLELLTPTDACETGESIMASHLTSKDINSEYPTKLTSDENALCTKAETSEVDCHDGPLEKSISCFGNRRGHEPVSESTKFSELSDVNHSLFASKILMNNDAHLQYWGKILQQDRCQYGIPTLNQFDVCLESLKNFSSSLGEKYCVRKHHGPRAFRREKSFANSAVPTPIKKTSYRREKTFCSSKATKDSNLIRIEKTTDKTSQFVTGTSGTNDIITPISPIRKPSIHLNNTSKFLSYGCNGNISTHISSVANLQKLLKPRSLLEDIQTSACFTSNTIEKYEYLLKPPCIMDRNASSSFESFPTLSLDGSFFLRSSQESLMSESDDYPKIDENGSLDDLENLTQFGCSFSDLLQASGSAPLSEISYVNAFDDLPTLVESCEVHSQDIFQSTRSKPKTDSTKRNSFMEDMRKTSRDLYKQIFTSKHNQYSNDDSDKGGRNFNPDITVSPDGKNASAQKVAVKHKPPLPISNPKNRNPLSKKTPPVKVTSRQGSLKVSCPEASEVKPIKTQSASPSRKGDETNLGQKLCNEALDKSKKSSPMSRIDRLSLPKRLSSVQEETEPSQYKRAAKLPSSNKLKSFDKPKVVAFEPKFHAGEHSGVNKKIDTKSAKAQSNISTVLKRPDTEQQTVNPTQLLKTKIMTISERPRSSSSVMSEKCLNSPASIKPNRDVNTNQGLKNKVGILSDSRGSPASVLSTKRRGSSSSTGSMKESKISDDSSKHKMKSIARTSISGRSLVDNEISGRDRGSIKSLSLERKLSQRENKEGRKCAPDASIVSGRSSLPRNMRFVPNSEGRGLQSTGKKRSGLDNLKSDDGQA